MKLGEVIRVLGSSAGAAELINREPIGYSIDSRTVREGELFFAIRGEKHDGHRFVADALAKGAIAAVVSRDFTLNQSDVRSPKPEVQAQDFGALIPVADTLAALQTVASAVLRSWRGREIAITGSMGKTTTKEMTAAALGRVGRVIKTTGNFNNAYGLPLSILKMESDGAKAADYDFAVFEMGMNHRGELTELTRIAPPDLGVVTNVAEVHLEFFPSVDVIADAKAELIAGVRPSGAAVLNGDDSRVARMRELRDDIKYRMFGIEHQADVMAREIRAVGLDGTRFRLATPRGQIEAFVPFAGRHNVYNALAGAAVADYCEVPLEEIAAAFAEVARPKMRGEIMRFSSGFTLVDDSYNSNPRALVEVVSTICGDEGCKRKIIVAGEMLELGAAGPALHREVGHRIAEHGVDLLIGVRGLAEEIVAGAREAGMDRGSAIFCATPDQAAEILAREVRAGDLILVKGSRGVRTDIVVERLKERML